MTAQRLNVRNKPSTQALVVGVLKQGETISVSEIVNGWATLTYNGKTRYVSATYLEQVKETKVVQEKPKEVNLPNPTESVEPKVTPSPIQEPTKTKKRHKERESSSDGHLNLIVDIFGGYSNFRCERVSPKSGLGFGADIGVQGEYNGFWQKIPSGIFGEFTAGYSCRGSGAYPLHCIGARLLPFGYRYKLNTEWALAGKAGVYFAYPFNGIRSYGSSFDYGISFGLGAEWKKFGLMASYEHGFSNMVSGASVKLYNQGAFLTISYKFFTFK